MKFTIILLLLLNPIFNIYSQTYTLEKSELKWTGKAAFDSYELSGTLKTSEGVLKISKNIITTLQIEVNMKSLDHENADLKKHLSGSDFFHIKKYKTAQFKLEQPAEIKNGVALLKGILIIKQTSKNVTIPIKIDLKSLSMSFNTKLNRVDYGITYNSPSVFEKLKENAIADDFILTGIITFKK